MSTHPPHPQLIAFDLDYTLWDLWIDTHVTGPLRRHKNTVNEVLDKHGETISFYADVPHILHRIQAHPLRVQRAQTSASSASSSASSSSSASPEAESESEAQPGRVIIAACSRTHAPELADQCLRMLLVPPPKDHTLLGGDGLATPRPAIEFFDELQIYPGSKLKHFKVLHERTGIAYSEMLFFDDEHRNSEVEKLGVTFCHVPRGLSLDMFERGLGEWRRRRAASGGL